MKKLEFYDTMLFVVDDGIAVISDIHLGREDISLAKNLGLTSVSSIKQRLIDAKIEFEKINVVKKLIINGDLYDDFGGANYSQKEELKEFIDFVKEEFTEFIYISGNHDTYINKYLETLNIVSRDYYITNGMLFIHGDKIIDVEDGEYNIIIIGHEHPSVVITDKIRHEHFKCFLYGKYKDKDIVVLPSFIMTSIGTNLIGVRAENILSPYLKENLKELNVVIVDDTKKTHYFGLLKELD